MSARIPFAKSYATPEDLISLLNSRGLHITDKACHYLRYIGYYRLTAYMYPFLRMPKELHLYKPGVTFDKVMMLYRFDKRLRMLLFNEIEKIEIAVRSTIVNIGCEVTADPFWMTDRIHFVNDVRFLKTVRVMDEELGHSREDFIVHFREKYSDSYPPAWILAEILPFGVMTHVYANLKNKKLKKRIAQSFGLQPAPFESWLTIITLTRNSCCHHARVWNKQNTIRPMLPSQVSHSWITLPTDTLRIYFNICIVKYFLNVVSPGNNMFDKLRGLLSAFPEVDVWAMGFPQGWEREPLWTSTVR